MLNERMGQEERVTPAACPNIEMTVLIGRSCSGKCVPRTLCRT